MGQPKKPAQEWAYPRPMDKPVAKYGVILAIHVLTGQQVM
jgi:hypothetical protein